MKYIIALFFSLMVFTACTSEPAEQETTTSDQLELTLAELATYNGNDGQPAYIAVDGVVYDVTESDAWKNGKHNGFEAGKDLTEEIKNQSPHGVSKLEGVTAIGVIVE